MGILIWLLGFLLGAVVLLGAEGYLFYRLWFLPKLAFKYPSLIRPPKRVKNPYEMTSIIGGDKMLKKEKAEWLNAVLMRLWFENYQKSTLKQFLRRKVLEELVDIKREPEGVFLKEYGVQDLFVGNYPPTFNNFTVLCTQQSGSSLVGVFDLHYNGDLCVIVNMTLSILDISLSVYVRIKEISGRAMIQYEKEPVETMAFGFLQPPELNLDIQSRLNGKSYSLINTLIGMAIRRNLNKKFALPNLKYYWFLNKPKQPPYPWEVDTEQQMYDWEDETKENLLRRDSNDSAELRRDSRLTSEGDSIASLSASNTGSAPRSSKHEPHSWFKYTCSPKTVCDLCPNELWGAARQGVKCSGCGLVAHEKCAASSQFCMKSTASSPI